MQGRFSQFRKALLLLLMICIQLWDVDTGQCLFVYTGHFAQIYAVAFDGQRIATGSLDSTVRIWSARTGYGSSHKASLLSS